MKKSFLLFPFFALALAGCSSDSSSSTNEKNADNQVEVKEANIPWQPEVHPTAMPNNMTQPNYYPPAQTLPQPISNNSYAYNEGAETESIGNCLVVRQGSTPIYSQIQKGCYKAETYTVGKKDTLFLISYLAGKNVNEIADLNNLSVPYQLKVGQVLRLR